MMMDGIIHKPDFNGPSELDQYKAHVAMLREALEWASEWMRPSATKEFESGDDCSCPACKALFSAPSDSYEEVKKLRAEIAKWSSRYDRDTDALGDEIAKLQAERDALAKDAEKWRAHEQRKADLINRGFLRSPLRDAAKGECK